MEGSAGDNVEVQVAPDIPASLVSGTHVRLTGPNNRRVLVSSFYIRRVMTLRALHRSAMLENNLHPLLQPNEQTIELNSWSSDTTPPAQTSFVFLC